MRYYLNIWLLTVKKSFSKEMVYRSDFATKVFRMFFVIATQLLIVVLLFSGEREVAGWSRADFMLLLGFYNLVNYLGWGIFNINLWRLEEKVAKGELDHYLLSPAGALFQVSFGEFFLDDIITGLSGVVMIGFYIVTEWSNLSLASVLAGGVLFILAFIIWYSLHLIVASFSLWKVQTGFIDLLKSITRIGAFPPEVYSPAIQTILYTLFPIAFIAAVPAQAMIWGNGLGWIVSAVVVCVIFLAVAILTWNWMIGRYNSSGS